MLVANELEYCSLAMLNSCASGVGVVNIDNGFGAAALSYAIVDTGRDTKHENVYLDCFAGIAGDMLLGLVRCLSDLM